MDIEDDEELDDEELEDEDEELEDEEDEELDSNDINSSVDAEESQKKLTSKQRDRKKLEKELEIRQ